MNKVSVQNFVRNYSIETTILEATRVGRFPDIVLPGTRIYIPQTPSTQFKDTIALAARLRRESMEPVPHVVARRIESLSVLDEFLARLAGDAGVTQILAVAGDTAKPEGQLHSALQILESGLLEKHRIRTIGQLYDCWHETFGDISRATRPAVCRSGKMVGKGAASRASRRTGSRYRQRKDLRSRRIPSSSGKVPMAPTSAGCP